MTKITYINIALPTELVEWARSRAQEQGVSVSTVIAFTVLVEIQKLQERERIMQAVSAEKGET